MKEKSILFIALLLLIVLIGNVIGETSTSNGAANLTIWDETDNSTKRSGWNSYFYANYTNATSGANISYGICEIRFQNYTSDYGSWTNMTYNPWAYTNDSLNIKEQSIYHTSMDLRPHRCNSNLN